ncbi:MAG: RNA polymerase sigma factor [Limisphaerales bacterium]
MSAFLQPLKALFAPADEQLMWRVQTQDDSQAFAELVGRWQEPIRRLCERLAGDVHRAEDLAQEVFAKLFARRHAYQTDRKFSAWLWRVALNHCYNELRRQRSRPETLMSPLEDEAGPGLEGVPGESPGPDEEAATRETADAIRQAVLALPESHRSIVLLRHYEGLKFREVAEVLDLPEGTVKTRMTEALSDLARSLRRSLELNVPPPTHRRARTHNHLAL